MVGRTGASTVGPLDLSCSASSASILDSATLGRPLEFPRGIGIRWPFPPGTNFLSRLLGEAAFTWWMTGRLVKLVWRLGAMDTAE
eukprot:7634488-Heterocapsa_arctica.AAC.1